MCLKLRKYSMPPAYVIKCNCTGDTCSNSTGKEYIIHGKDEMRRMKIEIFSVDLIIYTIVWL